MGISVIGGAGAGGGFVSNDFVVNMNDTANNVADLPTTFEAGAYQIALAEGAAADVYFLNENSELVGYSGGASIVASEEFSAVCVLGVAQNEVVTFSFAGAATDTNSQGDEITAGAYLESINPVDLPTIDDTATVLGGNFGPSVEVTFTSGDVELNAKQVTRVDSNELVVTRPDALDAALDPWSLKVINPGVQPPTATNSHILQDTVTAGAVPTWVTTSPLPSGTVNSAYTVTLEATDADGAVTYAVSAGSLPTGLTLDANSGVISGTPTAAGQTFTVTASDDGGNTASREFNIPLQLATGGTVTQVDGFTTHIFTSSDDFVALADIPTLEFFIVGGGASGGNGGGNVSGGGGGGGGIFTSISTDPTGTPITIQPTASVTAGTYAVTVGAGATTPNAFDANGNKGGDSSVATVGTAIGGGAGRSTSNGGNGGSGGGGGQGRVAGNGTPGQGTIGGSASGEQAGSGGGATEGGAATGSRRAGYTSAVTGTSVEYSSGGGGGARNTDGQQLNTPGSGSRGKREDSGAALAGQAGLVVVRY